MNTYLSTSSNGHLISVQWFLMIVSRHIGASGAAISGRAYVSPFSCAQDWCLVAAISSCSAILVHSMHVVAATSPPSLCYEILHRVHVYVSVVSLTLSSLCHRDPCHRRLYRFGYTIWQGKRVGRVGAKNAAEMMAATAVEDSWVAGMVAGFLRAKSGGHRDGRDGGDPRRRGMRETHELRWLQSQFFSPISKFSKAE